MLQVTVYSLDGSVIWLHVSVNFSVGNKKLQWSLHNYSVFQKKWATWCLIITLANVDRFSKFFHLAIRKKILYVHITKDFHLTSNMLLHYLTVFGTRCVYIHSGHLWLGCKSANFINIVTGTHITRYLDNVLAVMWSYMSQVEVWHLLLVLPAVTGKSKSQLGFKLQFVHTWQFDLRYNDSVWNTVVRFVIWVANFSIVFEQ